MVSPLPCYYGEREINSLTTGRLEFFVNKRVIFKWVFTLFFISSTTPLIAEDTIVLSTHLTKERYDYKVTFTIMQEAFKRNGLKLILKPLPGLRALVEADRGRTDGDAHRIDGILEKKGLHNLIRIPEIQQVVHDYAWAKKDISLKNGWSELSSYTVAVHLGTVFVSEKAKAYAKWVAAVGTTRQQFKMLDAGRVDLVIATLSNADILKTELRDSGIRRIYPPLTSLPIYTYLHKKHSTLVPKIAESLQAMKMDGTYQRLIQNVQ